MLTSCPANTKLVKLIKSTIKHTLKASGSPHVQNGSSILRWCTYAQKKNIYTYICRNGAHSWHPRPVGQATEMMAAKWDTFIAPCAAETRIFIMGSSILCDMVFRASVLVLYGEVLLWMNFIYVWKIMWLW